VAEYVNGSCRYGRHSTHELVDRCSVYVCKVPVLALPYLLLLRDAPRSTACIAIALDKDRVPAEHILQIIPPFHSTSPGLADGISIRLAPISAR